MKPREREGCAITLCTAYALQFPVLVFFLSVGLLQFGPSLFCEESTFTTLAGTRVDRVLNGRSNVYLVRCAGSTTLVDTSTTQERDILVAVLDGMGIDKIDFLFITHVHFDHVQNARFIAERYGASILVHESSLSLAAMGVNEPIRGSNLLTRVLVSLGNAYITSRTYDSFIGVALPSDHADLSVIGIPGVILETPGHTYSSVSLVVDGEIALVGDAMFSVIPKSIMPPYAVDPDETRRSWGKLLNTGARLFLPGHGGPVSRSLVESRYGN